MAEGSKSGNAAQAFQRHFDQDRAAHANQSRNHMTSTPGSFRNAQNFPAQQQLADQQYAQEQMARMRLEDVDGSAGPAFIAGHHGTPMHNSGHQSLAPGPHAHHAFSTRPIQQNVTANMSATGDPFFSVEEFKREYSSGQSGAVAGLSNAPMRMGPANPQLVGGQYPGTTSFGAQAYGPSIVGQVGFMPSYMGHNPALLGRSSVSQTGAQCSATEVQSDFKDVAAAWEASFEEAMNEWVTTQNNLEVDAMAPVADVTEAAEAAKEQTQDRPLNSSELARAAQQLVDAVSDNDSEKFRKSNFVDLMRRIAAQEIVVENNSLVEANTATAESEHETGDMSHMTGNTTAKDKGKGKAVANPTTVEDGDSA